MRNGHLFANGQEIEVFKPMQWNALYKTWPFITQNGYGYFLIQTTSL
jgi:hypothetical protein